MAFENIVQGWVWVSTKARSFPDTVRNCQKKQNSDRTEREDTHHFKQGCNSQIFPIAVIFINKTNPKLKFTLTTPFKNPKEIATTLPKPWSKKFQEKTIIAAIWCPD